MKPKNLFDKASLAVVLICAVLCVVFYPFLSDEIAIQWSGADVSSTANRLFIFVFPLISAALYLARFPIISFSFLKKGMDFEKENLISYIILVVEILLLTGTISIVLFDLGVPLRVGVIIVIEIILGAFIGSRIMREDT